MASKAYIILKSGMYLPCSMTQIADKAKRMEKGNDAYVVRAVSLSAHETRDADLTGYAVFVAGGRILPETFRSTELDALAAAKLLRLDYTPPVRRVYVKLRKQLGRGSAC